MTHIAIIGAGAIGQALAHILKPKEQVAIFMYDKDPAKITRSALLLPEAVASADVVFLCVPSWAMREAVFEMKLHLKRDAILVSLAKGIEGVSKKTMDALLKELCPTHKMAILGGPMLAAEFMADLPGVGCLATEQSGVEKLVKELFADTLLSLKSSTDVRGVALSGVLKNIYALGLGIAQGLSWGNNQKGWYVTNALSEMADIVELFGGKRETAYGLSGVGDLVATGFSPYSRNNHFGEKLVMTGVCNIKSEGNASLPALSRLLKKPRAVFPLLETLEDVILRGANAKERFPQCMARA
ncbi:MAG: Glycerol-3-phosphate dehydrogenase [NAD(P)+] [Parcubacteria group bacterium GW2011_GWA2_47_64]|nr:MAG: Glycerol-3-phosphate dehydrogenase [NAD(P)+] [Parcubacteria group bacterium GW2011_GWA2_47_64]KKU97065.1 MAG: Glycerol-3-phosphate dehydrogenase [NAD(P)+] [Parcubacteria group bacterium GW2011_GWC2_48_17]